jgi:predicted metal-dependent hydrolase
MTNEIPCTIIRRKVKYARLEFRPEGFRVIAPASSSFNVEEFLRRHDPWIRGKLALYQKLNGQGDLELHQRTERDLKLTVQELVKLACLQMNVDISSISYRTMKNRWGSCSSDKHLKFNSNLRYLPEHLIRYIVFHEVCHLRVMRHNKAFHGLLYGHFPEHKTHEQELLVYWHQINKNKKAS